MRTGWSVQRQNKLHIIIVSNNILYTDFVLVSTHGTH